MVIKHLIKIGNWLYGAYKSKASSFFMDTKKVQNRTQASIQHTRANVVEKVLPIDTPAPPFHF